MNKLNKNYDRCNMISIVQFDVVLGVKLMVMFHVMDMSG